MHYLIMNIYVNADSDYYIEIVVLLGEIEQHLI